MKSICLALASLALLAMPARAQETTPPEQDRTARTPTAEVDTIDTHIRTLTRQHMRQCWRMPTGEGAARLVVTVQFELNRDGTLNGQPRVTQPNNPGVDAPMRDAIERALEAVRRCAPFPLATDRVASDQYEHWRQMEFTFRPRPSAFDLEEVAGLIDREAGRGRQARVAPRDSANAIPDRVRAIFRAHIRFCWEPPVDRRRASRSVTVRFFLNEDGSLLGTPRVVSPRGYTFDPSLRTAGESAVAAVQQCAPFPFANDPVLGTRYEAWRDMEVVFALTPAPR